MTSDHSLLKEIHIVPKEIRAANWMEWRADEIEAMRELCDVLTWRGVEDRRDVKRWKLIASLLGCFAAMLFFIPIIERYWP